MTSCEFLRGIICLKLYQCTYRRKREEGKSWPCLRTSLIISTQSNQPFSNFHAAKFAAIRHASDFTPTRRARLCYPSPPRPSGERSQFAERGSLLTAFAGGTASNWQLGPLLYSTWKAGMEKLSPVSDRGVAQKCMSDTRANPEILCTYMSP